MERKDFILMWLIWACLCLIIFLIIQLFDANKKLFNISKTMQPIISQIAETLGNYENVQFGEGPAKGGKLIYKREPRQDCISKIGNVYYIRLYDWQWEGKRLWYKPVRDIPLGCHSCINEDEMLIPYWDQQLQNAELGMKYYVK